MNYVYDTTIKKSTSTCAKHLTLCQTTSLSLTGWTTQWISNQPDGLTQRTAVNSLMSKWRPVMTVVPQETILDLAQSNIHSLRRGTERTLSKCADHTKLCGLVDMLKGRDAI